MSDESTPLPAPPMPSLQRKPNLKLIAGAAIVLIAVALAGYFFFIAGQPALPPAESAPVVPSEQTPAQKPEMNISIGNATVPKENVTGGGEEKVPAVPRNVSSKISDGRFAIKENFAAPLKVYVIDGNHADSVLVNKGEFYMLVDAGSFSQADAFLKKLGVERLNVVVATRDYSGAISGLPALLDAYAVGELWENGAAQQGTDYYSLLEKARGKGITIKTPVALDRMEVNGLAVAVLNPQRQRIFSNPDNDAIVLKLSAGNFCMLLLNPTVQERENALISTGESLRCDAATYYKHGEGRPEPSVLIGSYALPKDVIISVGKNNSVGLPSNTTITRLTLKSVKVWRTDTDGTVLVEAKSDGSSYSVSKNN